MTRGRTIGRTIDAQDHRLASRGPIAALPAAQPSPFTGPNGTPGGPRQYEVEELTPIVNRALRGGRNYEQGKKVFETIGCTMCHLFGGGAGGIGPDLSGVGGRFGAFEILQSILEPSANVSDLYSTKIIITKDDKTVKGKLDSEGETNVVLIQSPLFDPETKTMSWAGGPKISVKTSDIVSINAVGTNGSPVVIGTGATAGGGDISIKVRLCDVFHAAANAIAARSAWHCMVFVVPGFGELEICSKCKWLSLKYAANASASGAPKRP